eukprot:TRINITY_DN16095_c1_g1::TRINITY_DN16095_c1_g1_i1::g.13730::m.13730 TRINITY_DN16095_c1_g1::TRINITY_DN16095_c1_g1_i1::g.13730  ORF type:complete len:234 (-),score=11.96,Claudin_2/PF13903.1/6.5e+02,Claudin_2/PF13903.1/9e-05,PMP22_Claudin/PF00822.15/0.00012,PTR2/PF00854.16/0.0058,MARVEL/PF01284.18/0.35,DUF3955/PF13127.1/1.2e+03,DUF3955/PF13127.1/4.6e+02,DUF3955/PF13127.1/1.3,DUF3955/PF13127.1/4.3e+02 TRINITY_DN16095_c1_g1_i1:101-727(-)
MATSSQSLLSLPTISFLAVTAIALHIVSISGPEISWFYKHGADNDYDFTFKLGLEKYRFCISNECVDYSYKDYDSLDSSFVNSSTAALALGILCILFLGMALTLYALYATRKCHTLLKNRMRLVKPFVTGIFLLSAGMNISSYVQYQGMVKDQDLEDCDGSFSACRLDTGFYLSIAASVVTFLAGLMHAIFFTPTSDADSPFGTHALA